jgi:hypothetical protein
MLAFSHRATWLAMQLGSCGRLLHGGFENLRRPVDSAEVSFGSALPGRSGKPAPQAFECVNLALERTAVFKPGQLYSNF